MEWISVKNECAPIDRELLFYDKDDKEMFFGWARKKNNEEDFQVAIKEDPKKKPPFPTIGATATFRRFRSL